MRAYYRPGTVQDTEDTAKNITKYYITLQELIIMNGWTRTEEAHMKEMASTLDLEE